MSIVTGRNDITLLDVADRLLDTGVCLNGEATISVADVDLIYLGLSVALMSVERAEREPLPATAGHTRTGSDAPARRPVSRASGSLARNMPDGPGAMSAALYAPEAAAIRRESVRPVQGTSSLASRAEQMRAELPDHIDVHPDDVERGLAKLVLTIVEFVRQLLERQAIRRMEAGSLTEAEVERVGVALMRLEEKVGEMAGRFGIEQRDLTLRLGPLGELL